MHGDAASGCPVADELISLRRTSIGLLRLYGGSLLGIAERVGTVGGSGLETAARTLTLRDPATARSARRLHAVYRCTGVD